MSSPTFRILDAGTKRDFGFTRVTAALSGVGSVTYRDRRDSGTFVPQRLTACVTILEQATGLHVLRARLWTPDDHGGEASGAEVGGIMRDYTTGAYVTDSTPLPEWAKKNGGWNYLDTLVGDRPPWIDVVLAQHFPGWDLTQRMTRNPRPLLAAA